jgi:hypothetical protein
MPDYQKAKIYKLFSPSKNLVYYGSTTESLSTRLAKHAYCFRHPEKYNGKRDASIIMECNDYKIELVKDFPCNNIHQLAREEGIYIKNNQCINKSIAGRTHNEWRVDNADKLKEQARQYSIANADKIREYQKEYRINNADKIKAYYKKYKKQAN